ncbi:MAG: hypothetical protein AB1483_03305 [Candidatus Zixiibacteriota bacterium]
MRFVLVFVTMALLCNETTDSVVMGFLSSIDPKFENRRTFASATVDQPFFEDVVFVDIDTFVTFIHPTPRSEIPLRIGIDKAANVYRLFGFDTNQYNDIIASEPLSLGADQIRPYGEFYLDLTQLWDPFDYMFIASIESFIAENRRRMVEAESGDSGYDCDRCPKWDELEAQIRAMLAGVVLDSVVWSEKDSVYEAEYIAWGETTGALRYFRLMVHPNGRCVIARDSLWSESFGYYYKYQM